MGAKTLPNANILEFVNNYHSKDLRSRLFRITSIIKRNNTYTSIFPALKHINTILFKELYDTKKEALQEVSFITKKRILFRWYLNKSFFVSLKEVFFL